MTNFQHNLRILGINCVFICLVCAVMVLKTLNQWKEYEWWIEAKNPLKPMLWITEQAILEGRHWATLGTVFGQIPSIGTTPNNLLIFFVTIENEPMTKFRLKRKFLMASIPVVLFEVNPPLRRLKPLKVF